MNLFMDTSALVKLYHREAGTPELERFFATTPITGIYLAEIAKIEFASTIWKKVRTQNITTGQADKTLALFEKDFAKYVFVTTDSLIIERARLLISKYGHQGLRTLDSIQLATATSLTQQADLFLTADNLLQSFFQTEGLAVELPSQSGEALQP